MLRPPLTPHARTDPKAKVAFLIFGMCMVYDLRGISVCYGGVDGFYSSRSASQSAYSVRGSFRAGRVEELMDASKYEKSFDNRCAAMVSREGRAPRAGHNRKYCIVSGLRLISLLIMARGS